MISWDWGEALRGAVCATPGAALLLLVSVDPGIVFAIGVLPVALMGALPSRKQRLQALALGVAFAATYLLGSVLSQVPTVAVVAMFGVAYGAVVLTGRRPIGRVVLGVVLPALAVGLSADPAAGLVVASSMLVGAAWATAVATFWPSRAANAGRPPLAPEGRRARFYGLLLASAVSIALALGYAFDLGHLGWAPAAVVFVMRPQRDLLTARGAGRVLATLAGVVFAWLVVRQEPSELLLAAAVVGAVAAVLATRASRWYVTPAGTVTLVMLLVGTTMPDMLAYTLTERLRDTLLGMGLGLRLRRRGAVHAREVHKRRRVVRKGSRASELAPGAPAAARGR